MTGRQSATTVSEGTGGIRPPLPRDLPDQQVQPGEDPLDVPSPPETGKGTRTGDTGSDDASDGLPGLDESGAGRGEPRQAGAHPEHPVPDEQTG
ncbi:hypothetical protein OG909_30775 [Streptomyces sp. NBC_01754]|uniref:hypothetical protein n=1 Tax=Streptomyces sp. NBC_01754 TaxID=2975930 RepID=UPI002DDA7455|nr:hypothetical protein [Streptomyces sp. NBC_01754]WSC96335.1 hypothetical protein OG909_30775 [Streptomyces sp. NBC_01754]